MNYNKADHNDNEPVHHSLPFVQRNGLCFVPSHTAHSAQCDCALRGLGVGIAQLLQLFVSALPVSTPWSYAALAETVAVLIGLIAGVLPARRAAGLDPVEALRAE